MKIKITLTTLSAIIALALTTMSAFSQSHSFSPPQNMGATLNTADVEQHMAITPNGLSLYFTSGRAGGQGVADIWVSKRATLGSAWGVPQNLGATVNTSSGELAPAFSLDGRTMFFQSDRPGTLGLDDIYLSTRTDPNDDFSWTAPVHLGAIVNSVFDDRFPEYFVDPTNGNAALIFSSSRPGGPGSDDLYQSTRNANGTFNAPTPINELNTAGPDLGTAISREGLEIFISSFGVISLGISVSIRTSTTSPWNPPVLVPGINIVDLNEFSPALSPDGAILYFNRPGAGGFGNQDLYSAIRCSLYITTPCLNRSSAADFDGDGRSDISVFRPSDGTWYVMQSGTNTLRAQPFGLNEDKITPGDYDGDGRTDFAVFRPSTGVWWILKSSGSVSTTNWGLATDKPVPGDYDGDGRADIAVYRDGTWYIIQSSNGSHTYANFGLSSDIPVAGSNMQ